MSRKTEQDLRTGWFAFGNASGCMGIGLEDGMVLTKKGNVVSWETMRDWEKRGWVKRGAVFFPKRRLRRSSE